MVFGKRLEWRFPSRRYPREEAGIQLVLKGDYDGEAVTSARVRVNNVSSNSARARRFGST
jgi:hypothetical protein